VTSAVKTFPISGIPDIVNWLFRVVDDVGVAVKSKAMMVLLSLTTFPFRLV